MKINYYIQFWVNNWRPLHQILAAVHDLFGHNHLSGLRVSNGTGSTRLTVVVSILIRHPSVLLIFFIWQMILGLYYKFTCLSVRLRVTFWIFLTYFQMSDFEMSYSFCFFLLCFLVTKFFFDRVAGIRWVYNWNIKMDGSPMLPKPHLDLKILIYVLNFMKCGVLIRAYST